MVENDIFKALADPTRRAIFEKLAAGRMNASSLRSGLDISQPAMSQHLAVLRNAGLVREEREGRFMNYEVDPDGLALIARWLPDRELRIYSDEFARTGFQGALQWYRNLTEARMRAKLQLWSGRTIDVPSCFIAGDRDWGIHQRPGDLARMQREACTRMSGVHLVPGAGHWVQQERPQETARHILAFLREQG